VYGGGNVGLMGIIADGVLRAVGEVQGVILDPTLEPSANQIPAKSTA
jgi:predicted Rossmann-fold nucleotide-binding protein